MSDTKCTFNYSGCRALTDTEIEKILAGMTGRHALRSRAVFIFGLRTGFRISEILSLAVGEVWADGEVKNVVTVTKDRMKGGRKSRSMPLHSQAKEALAIYLRHAKLDCDFCLQMPLFPSQGGAKPLNKKTFWAALQVAAERSGVSTDRLGTHSLRKSFCSKMYPRLGGDLLKMSAVLGDNPTNTAKYVQFLDGSLEAAVLGA